MKCAGAAALAIAASGILTGCDNTLDVEVTFVYNGQTLPLRGTGKVVTGEQYMDTATIVLPAEYQEQYKVRAEKVKVIRENGTRKAVVELVVKTAVWTVSYRLGEEEVLSGSVEAAAVNPTVTVNDLNKNELNALGEKFYQLPKDAKVTIGNGVVIVPVEKIMGTVSIEYRKWSSFNPGDVNKDNVTSYGVYNETVQIWKGQSTVSTDEMSKLKAAQASYGNADRYTYERIGTTNSAKENFRLTDKFTIDWAQPVVQVYLYDSKNILF
jgi:hypothetical protein